MGRETMKTADMVKVVRRWFRKAGQAMGPVLPDGWFGRPYDNLYELKNIAVDGDVFTIHLSQDTSLEFHRLGRVHIDDSQLVLEDFSLFSLRWREYGGVSDLEKRYDTGQVRLVPPVGTNIAVI